LLHTLDLKRAAEAAAQQTAELTWLRGRARADDAVAQQVADLQRRLAERDDAVAREQEQARTHAEVLGCVPAQL
jgi:uncharacterized protein YigA (DUF484 family)